METILIYLIVYAVIGLAFGMFDDGVPFLRKLCRYMAASRSAMH